MHKKKKPNFFTSRGKEINQQSYVQELKQGFVSQIFNGGYVDRVSSLVDDSLPKKQNNSRLRQLLAEMGSFLNASIKIAKSLTKKDFVRIWVAGSYTAFTFAALLILVYPLKVKQDPTARYSIYASRPLSMSSIEFEIYSRDARSQKINQVFKKYKCPLEGLGEIFVYEADKYDIPWWIVAAISFQESSCGKMTPEPEGIESYNAWGWAVYGDNVQSFDNWVRGIETVSEYMHKRFYSQGITEPCDIMKVYTPPSKGSWCEGVKYFGEEIITFASEIEE